jgi:DNA polymerase III alpha subunit
MKKITRPIEKQGYYGAAIADFESMYGIPEFVHAMEEIKKPYLVGINITIDGVNLCLYVLNEEGYHHLINIHTAIQKNELTLAFLAKNSSGLTCVIETNYGAFKERFSTLDKIDTTFTKWLNEYSKLFDSRFYLGIEVVDLVSKTMMEKVRTFAKEYNYQCLAFPRLCYEKKDDAIVLKIVSAIGEGTFIKEKKAVGYEYFMTEADYHKIYSENEIEITNDLI